VGGGEVLESNNIVAWFDGGDTITDGLYYASAFVPEDDGEGAFGVFARESVCICVVSAEVYL
jgi:hypothetical protein